MSNIPKPHELEALLEFYSEKLEDYSNKFNPIFSQKSLELKSQADLLKSKIEKYASYSRNHQLRHLILSDVVISEIKIIHLEVDALSSKFKEIEKMFHLGRSLL